MILRTMIQMTLKQKVINILKIQEKDISVLAKEMNIPEAELLSLLERTDLTPQFIESLSHHLRLSSKDLMKDDSKSIPLGVYDFKYDKQIRKEWFRNSFNSILFVVYLSISIVLCFLLFAFIPSEINQSFIIGIICTCLMALITILYPLVCQISFIKRYNTIKNGFRIAVYPNEISYYRKGINGYDFDSSFSLNDTLIFSETTNIFYMTNQKFQSQFIYKNDLSNDEIEMIRDLIRKNSMINMTRESIPFEQFNMMKTYEKARKQRKGYIIVSLVVSFVLSFLVGLSAWFLLSNLSINLYQLYSVLIGLGYFALVLPLSFI